MSSINPIKFVTYVDYATDIIPVVSNVKNLIILFLKCVYKCLPESMTFKSHFWQRIETANFRYCLVLTFVPILSNLLAIKAVSEQIKERKSSAFRQAIMTAVFMNDAESIHQILSEKNHPSIEFRSGDEGRTPLTRACLLGKFEAVKALVEHGAMVDASDGRGQTPLSIAQGLEDQSIYNYLQQIPTAGEKIA